MEMIKFTNKELGVKLRAKVEYGNCAQLDKLRVAARQAGIKIDIQDQQLAAAKAEIAELKLKINRVRNNNQKLIGFISEKNEIINEIKQLTHDCNTDDEFDVKLYDLLAKHKGE